MPQFILDHGSPEASKQFRALDSFTQGYIEAMFFTSTGTGGDEELENATVAELAPETLQAIISDCGKFQEGLAKDGHGRTALDLAYDYATIEYDASQAGRDFWLTRNHHGAGYWDRGLGAVGDTLTQAAHAWRETDLYRGDDGLLYLA